MGHAYGKNTCGVTPPVSKIKGHKTALGIKSTVPKIALFLSNPHITSITLKRITAIDSVLCCASPGKKCGRFSVHPTSFSRDCFKTSGSDTLLVFRNVNRFIKRSIWILSDEIRSKLIPSRTTGVKSRGYPLKHTWSSLHFEGLTWKRDFRVTNY